MRLSVGASHRDDNRPIMRPMRVFTVAAVLYAPAWSGCQAQAPQTGR
jgi:hypothetical protein